MKEYQKYLNEVINQDNFVGKLTRDEFEEVLDDEKRMAMSKTFKDYKGQEHIGIVDVYNLKADQYGNVDKNDPIFNNPKIRWFRVPQSGRTVEEFSKNPDMHWGSGIVALFPDGNWVWHRTDWDSSG